MVRLKRRRSALVNYSTNMANYCTNMANYCTNMANYYTNMANYYTNMANYYTNRLHRGASQAATERIGSTPEQQVIILMANY